MKKNFIKNLVILILSLFFYAEAIAEVRRGNITYVNLCASGLNNGSSWENAYTDLQDALADPRSNEIWVAEGIYAPINPIASETNGFFIDGFGAEGMVFGGFKGDETQLQQRNPDKYLTILEQSNQTAPNNTNILYSTSKSNDIVFDGFTISTFLDHDPEVVNEIVFDTRLVNCWIGEILINNLGDFNFKDGNTLKSYSLVEKLVPSESLVETTFSIFPTIATSQITIESSVPSKVELIDYLGSIVFSAEMTASPLQINVSDLPRGIYIAKVRNSGFGVKTNRIVLK